MDDLPAAGAVPRKPYRAPEVVRVDMFEDEVALAACKAGTSGPVNSSGVSGINKKCKSACKAVRSS
jgi:hypothetical protein